MSDVSTACFDELSVGQLYSTVNIVTDEDILKFAEVTGDVNPIHLDEDYAKVSVFGERIAHGMISAGYISAIFGTRFPGAGSIYLSQSLKFKAPVKIGDTVETTVSIIGLNEKRKFVSDVSVLTGEALLKVPD